MASTKQERSIRLLGRKTLDLDRITGSNGEVFYDTDTQSLRIYSSGGSSVVLATRTWVTANSPQSDWNQATSTAADFIKNKPAIPTNTNQLTNGAGFITATGIPAQTGNSGKYLTTNGTAVSWATVTATVTASDVGLGNVTNESKATMFASPTFTGTVAGVTATHVGLGSVTNESKATMFTSPAFTGNVGINVAGDSQYSLTVNGIANIRDLYMNQNTGAGAVEHNIYMDSAAGPTTVKFTTNGANYINSGNVYIGSSSALGGALLTVNGRVYATSLVLGGSTSGTVSFSAGTTPAVQAYTLPAAYPAANGYALTSTTGGVLSWASAGGGGTTTNALTFSTGLSLNGGTTFDGSAAKTVSLATSGVTAQTVGSSTAIPVFAVDTYGRITSVTTAAVNTSASNSFANIYANAGGTLSSPMSGGSSVGLSASSSSDTLYLLAGTNVTITANSSSKGIMISSTGGAATGITWSTNTSPSGSITVTNPAGYATSGSTMVIVVVGLSVSSSSASSGSGSFSTAASVGQNTRVFYTYTTSSLGTTTTISSITGYAMAYAYIGSGPSIATTSTSTSATSTTLMNPSPVYGTPRIIAVSQSSSLNLATLAGPATGGGPTWATGSGFVHPNDSQLSAAVWVGTGSWTTMATPTITSNPSFMSWYLTGISIG